MTSHEDHTGLAKIVNDVRYSRYHNPSSIYRHVRTDVGLSIVEGVASGPLVDATFIHNTWREKIVADRKPVEAQFPSVRPPWPVASIGYVDRLAASVVTFVAAVDWENVPDLHHLKRGDGLPITDGRWYISGASFINNPSALNNPSATIGPVALFSVVVAEDGAPIYQVIHPVGDKINEGAGLYPLITTLATFSLLNSTNCSIVESPLSRPLRRAEQRYGVRSHVIQVTTSNRGRAGSRAGEPSTITYPLTSVRGHHAHYGDCCPRFHEPKGLLFGKLTGRVWVPQYARGDETVGRVEQTFIMGDGE